MQFSNIIFCNRTIHHLQNLSITMLSTDQHVPTKKLMKTDEKFKYSKHQFDPWHVYKRICSPLQ